MGRSRQLWLANFLIVFFFIQLFHTFVNVNHWPFCSYNMFNVTTPSRVITLKAILYQADGSRQTVSPGRILPIEFFRANNLVSEVYRKSDQREVQDLLSADIIFRLNNAPWGAFDETFSSARPIGDSPFTGIEIVACEENFADLVNSPFGNQSNQTTLYGYPGAK
jgi:hypothetical protein